MATDTLSYGIPILSILSIANPISLEKQYQDRSDTTNVVNSCTPFNKCSISLHIFDENGALQGSAPGKFQSARRISSLSCYSFDRQMTDIGSLAGVLKR